MDFISWLEALPPETVAKLYCSHWACQAVLRGLPPVAKHYVLRLLYLDGPVATGESLLVFHVESTTWPTIACFEVICPQAWWNHGPPQRQRQSIAQQSAV